MQEKKEDLGKEGRGGISKRNDEYRKSLITEKRHQRFFTSKNNRRRKPTRSQEYKRRTVKGQLT